MPWFNDRRVEEANFALYVDKGWPLTIQQTQAHRLRKPRRGQLDPNCLIDRIIVAAPLGKIIRDGGPDRCGEVIPASGWHPAILILQRRMPRILPEKIGTVEMKFWQAMRIGDDEAAEAFRNLLLVSFGDDDTTDAIPGLALQGLAVTVEAGLPPISKAMQREPAPFCLRVR